MLRVDAAAGPTLVVGGLACAALSCLFLTSAAILAIILVKRARRPPVSGVAEPDDHR
jgi:hypothetical protein